ncbi:restriction endonuclease subunit S, partial [Patescibacteria group bacterium]|nr:restriction endonuclease subunit S [Patescibacteria group bacterium]
MAKSEKMGKVPKGWKMVQLGEVLNYEQPQKYLVLSEEYDKRTGIPVLTAGKSFILGYTEEQFGIYRNLPVIIFDDFTTDSRYVNFPFKLKSSAIKILKNKNNENISFSIYNAVQLLKYKPGSEHKRFWISEYSKIYVFLPPPHEQRKIAEILETVDKALEKADKIIEKHKRIKQGLMQDLLTKGIDENGQMRSEKTHRFRDSPLGRIPQEWDAVKLGEIAGINMG